MLNGFRRIWQSNFVLVTFISMHNLWKCSIPSTMSRVKCVCVFVFVFIRAKAELNRPVNVMSISQTFIQGLSPSHLLQGHGNSRVIPDTTLSMAHKTHTRTGTLRQIERKLTRELKISNNDSDGNGNDNGKTAIHRINKQNNFASASHFLFFSFFVDLYFIFIFFARLRREHS